MANTRRKPPITFAFGSVFRQIIKREHFASPPIPELYGKKYDALIAAALAKCVAFNVVVNRSRRHNDEDFIFVAGLRGLCEDLIYLSYLSTMPSSDREEIIRLIISLNIADGTDVQHDFFRLNNPFQPVLSSETSPTGERASVAARTKFRSFWKAQRSSRRDGPTIKDMANLTGLTSTYDYMYFAASNFAHFNPQSLLRMGWGNEEGPFRFSVAKFNAYYKSLCSFYGSIIFIGFHSAFSPEHFTNDCNADVNKLINLIGQVHRWPEIVTFEEMNLQPPSFFLTHALGRVMAKNDPLTTPYGAILEEIRGLRQRLHP
jgi:hypothetical protein